MKTPRTPTPILIEALRILSRDIQSEDGVANAAIAEAADRIEWLEKKQVEAARAAALLSPKDACDITLAAHRAVSLIKELEEECDDLQGYKDDSGITGAFAMP